VAYYVTTPIYYVNAEPHLGHAYTTIAADVLARHMRQRGERTFFLTGTDEHGEPVAQAAEKLGTTPKELADRNAERFLDLAARLNVTNDFFIRTSDPRHVARVQEVLQLVHDAGYVYAGHYEGWYCPRCADFKTDAELIEGDKCPIHLIALEREKEDNWFFRLGAFQEPLERLYAERPDWVLPRNRYNEALSFITQGLQDVSLSRAKLSWGVPVPWDEGQVFYVWFDALLNYQTALAFAHEGEDLTGEFWPPSVHLIGKDILKFHAVIWPALLMAAGLEVPRRLFIHGYLLQGDHKMSKSLGNVIDPFAVIDELGVDALRYYLFAAVGFGQDGAVAPEDLEQRYNAELANEYGNLASRTLSMVGRYRDGMLPDATLDDAFPPAFDDLAERMQARLDECDLTGALADIWELVRALNLFIQERQPWKLAADEADAAEVDRILYTAAEGLRVVSVLVHPFLPESAEKLLAALAAPDLDLGAARLGAVPGGRRVEPLEPLFPRIEPRPA